MNKQDFLKDVEAELRSIKAIATKEELSKLEISSFDPQRPSQCIYGQLTGDCNTPRAHTIMDASCKRVMNFALIKAQLPLQDAGFEIYYTIMGAELDLMLLGVNGEYDGQPWREDENVDSPRYNYMSVLEAYIQSKGANNTGILAWLKGETEEFPIL